VVPDGKQSPLLTSKNPSRSFCTRWNQRKWSVLAEPANAQGMRWSTDGILFTNQEMGDLNKRFYRVRLVARCPKKFWALTHVEFDGVAMSFHGYCARWIRRDTRSRRQMLAPRETL